MISFESENIGMRKNQIETNDLTQPVKIHDQNEDEPQRNAKKSLLKPYAY